MIKMAPRRESRLLRTVQEVLERGTFRVEELRQTYLFVMTDIHDVEFYSLRWEIFKNADCIPFDSIKVNNSDTFVSPHICRQIAEASAEYAVMFKLES